MKTPGRLPCSRWKCLDEFRAQKSQSERLAAQLAQLKASPVDAFMIYVFRYCPAVFYCIPIMYFTPAQCKQIQSPFINVLLPRLRMHALEAWN